MNKTIVVVSLFLAALLAGLFLSYSSGPLPRTAEEVEDKVKEKFFQREVGMPLDMQSVEGVTGVSGYNGTPPLLGSEPKPVSEKPYDMADDTALYQFKNNKISADCCPSPFSSDQGCVCLTDAQIKEFETRGGNRSA
jgi:hypothetical protein